MRWIYGKQDFATIERSEENCFLMTNGLGGFSSLTIGGGAARNDHSVLMAALSAPGERYNIVHRLRERLYIGGTCKVLSSRSLAWGRRKKGTSIFAPLSGKTALYGGILPGVWRLSRRWPWPGRKIRWRWFMRFAMKAGNRPFLKLLPFCNSQKRGRCKFENKVLR